MNVECPDTQPRVPSGMSRSGPLTRALVAHAIDVVEEFGLEGFSGREVARRAGVSPAAPRRHFPNLAALLSAVAASGSADLRARLDEAARNAPISSTDELVAVGMAYLKFARERPAMFDLMGRADVLESSEASTFEGAPPILPPMFEAVRRAGGAGSPVRTIGICASIHGVALFSRKGAMEQLAPDVPAEVAERMVLAQLIEARP